MAASKSNNNNNSNNNNQKIQLQHQHQQHSKLGLSSTLVCCVLHGELTLTLTLQNNNVPATPRHFNLFLSLGFQFAVCCKET
jgi:hypothetical protein